MTPIIYAEYETAIVQARLGIAPAELHGSVTGYLCAGGSGSARELLTALALETDDAAAGRLQALLDDLAGDVARRLGADGTVAPLLPPGPLSVRANAMVDWCRGFLSGLGLTGKLGGVAAREPTVRELLDDFGRIAAMCLASDEDDESSLEQVLDFIRAGVGHLHSALASTGRP
jgi:uncharacterized protein YgfB (UPF0149 family)